MRKYEAIYIVDAKLTDLEVQAVADKFKSIVESKEGKVESAGKWEKKKLAYPIKGHKEGNYILMNFEALSSIPNELSRLMRISDDVIRHRIFLLEG